MVVNESNERKMKLEFIYEMQMLLFIPATRFWITLGYFESHFWLTLGYFEFTKFM